MYQIYVENVSPKKGGRMEARDNMNSKEKEKQRRAPRPHSEQFLFHDTTVKDGLGHFPFVRTDQPDHFRRNDNLTLNQNYPSRSINFEIVYGDGVSAKTHRKASFIVEMTVPAMVRLPWVPEAFYARFPVSVKSKLREAPRRTR